jgi:hypothetical protein
MAGGCRDCTRCTESSMGGCLMTPIRSLIFLCGGFLVSWFQRGCPQCGHKLKHHHRIAGRFAD